MTAASARLQQWGASTLKTARGEAKSSLKSLALVIGTGVLIAAVEYVSGNMLGYVQVRLLFLLPIIVAVVCWGMVAGVVAAIAGNAVWAYWFYPPSFSLEAMLDEDISDARLFANVAMLGILLAGIVLHQTRAAARREAELQQLYVFSRKLARANSTSDIFGAIQSHLASILERRVVLLRPESSMLACIPEGAELPSSVRTLARDMLGEEADVPGRVCKDCSDVNWLVRRVSAKTAAFGVIAVQVGSEKEASIEKFSRQIAATLADAVEALELLELDRAIRDKTIRAEADRLREAMIGAVSHDLGTPLSTILCSATVLSAVPSVVEDERVCGLVNAIREEAERHGKDIENLLDASRINGNAVQIHRQWTDLNDVINSAIERLQYRRGVRDVRTRVPNELPLVYVDTLLLERALIQVLDNAAKYSTADAPIELAAELGDDHVRLTISDGGSGLSENEKAAIWRRFFRGERHVNSTRGSGLGLWIAQAFVAANGGSIDADSIGPGQGTTVSIVLPRASDPPSDAADTEDNGHD